jgi:hypothetical protein
MKKGQNTMSKKTWWNYLPEDIQKGKAPLTDEVFWQAVADANDLDVSEIADGDVFDWL